MTTTTGTLFFLPGLGNDSRLFIRLLQAMRLDERLPGFTAQIVKYPEPVKDEPFVTYASRLAQQVPAGKPTVIIGMSMGGMLAQELTRYVNADLVVLISTVKHAAELPWYLGAATRLGLTRMVTGAWVKRLLYVGSPLKMGDGMTERDAELFNAMLFQWTDAHVAWGMRRVFGWRGAPTPHRVLHIHGTADRVFPYKLLKPAVHTIVGGRHFMVVSRAEEIAEPIVAAVQTLVAQTAVPLGTDTHTS